MQDNASVKGACAFGAMKGSLRLERMLAEEEVLLHLKMEDGPIVKETEQHVKVERGTSLVVQWLRTCFARRGCVCAVLTSLQPHEL